MDLSRRDLLRATGAAGLALTLPARASVDGSSPPPRPRILEIFLQGGMDPRFALLGSPEGETTTTYGGVAQDIYDQLCSDEPYVDPEVRGGLGVHRPVPAGTRWADGGGGPYLTAAGFAGLSFGPSAKPLVTSGLARRMRIAYLSHGIGAHPPAQELAQTGTLPGRDRAAGLAAAIQHDRGPGVSTVVASAAPQLVRGARLTGLHGSSHTPIFLRTGANGLAALFDRSARDGTDPVRDTYYDRFDQQLTAGGNRLRSRAWDDLARAWDGVASWEEVSFQLGPILDDAALSANCRYGRRGARDFDADTLHGAISVLCSSSRTVEYACVGVGNFDTHTPVLDPTAPVASTVGQHWELWRVARVLAQRAAEIEAANLLVVLNTEFGRIHEGGGRGSAHWPNGYVVALIGGPVVAAGVANGLAASSTRTVPVADGAFTPTDLRAALAQVANLDPFAADMYERTSCGTRAGGATSDSDAATTIYDAFFGT